jgi:hypothetical protein
MTSLPIRIALVAGLGVFSMMLPAAAAPAALGGTDLRTSEPASIKLAQYNRTRAISEARGGDYKKKAKKKKKK